MKIFNLLEYVAMQTSKFLANFSEDIGDFMSLLEIFLL